MAYAFRNIYLERPEQVAQQANIAVPNIANDATPELNTKLLLSGIFRDGDAVHSGSGDVSVVKTNDSTLLVFGDNFKVTNGPDLFVYLSPNAPGKPLGDFISLGELKNTSGPQAYNLPNDYSDYKTVIVWCRAFGVTFATAELR